MSTIVCQNNLASHFESQHTTTLKLKVAENINRDFETSSSFSSMSAESLDLCTENLGSESGSDVTSGDVNILSNPSYSPTRRKSEKESVFDKKTKNYLYPPPLTTIKNLQMRRHREEGRLIIEAVEMNSYLQAERSDGRLRLCFFNGVEQEEEEDDDDDDDDDIEEESEKEMEMEKYHQRLSWCHNTRGINEGLCCSTSTSNWKPALWVASS